MKGLIYVTMVDKKDDSARAMLLDMMLRVGMNPALEAGVRAFVSEWTPSHNVASKKFSIWSLLSKHIDVPVMQSLGESELESVLKTGFSKWLRLRIMTEMIVYFKLILRRNSSNPELLSNIESLIEISYFVLSRKPAKSIEDSNLKGSVQRNNRKQVNLIHYPFCELCWRLSQAAVRDMDNPERTYATLRFCIEHDPSVPTSDYRSGHRYRDQFHNVLKEIRLARNPQKLSDIEMRIYAYKQCRKRKFSRAEDIIKFNAQGFKQADIAKRLKITRQAVSKTLKNHK